MVASRPCIPGKCASSAGWRRSSRPAIPLVGGQSGALSSSSRRWAWPKLRGNLSLNRNSTRKCSTTVGHCASKPTSIGRREMGRSRWSFTTMGRARTESANPDRFPMSAESCCRADTRCWCPSGGATAARMGSHFPRKCVKHSVDAALRSRVRSLSAGCRRRATTCCPHWSLSGRSRSWTSAASASWAGHSGGSLRCSR